MKYECAICHDTAEDDGVRKPWGWVKDESGRDRCPGHVMPCPECGEVEKLVRTGCAFGCKTCGVLWIKQLTMLSSPLFDLKTITREIVVVTPGVYKMMRQGCAKFDVQCVKLKLKRKAEGPRA